MTPSQRRRRALIERDGSYCRYCGHPLSDPDPGAPDGVIFYLVVDEAGEPHVLQRPAPGYRWPEVDHVVPRAAGGGDELTNLVLACGPCNSAKGAMALAEFMALES